MRSTTSPLADAKPEFTTTETFHFAGITAGEPGERPLAFCPLDQSRDVHKVMARYHMDQPWGDSLGTPPRLMAAGDVVLKCGHRNVGYRHIGIRHGLGFKQLVEATNYRWWQILDMAIAKATRDPLLTAPHPGQKYCAISELTLYNRRTKEFVKNQKFRVILSGNNRHVITAFPHSEGKC